MVNSPLWPTEMFSSMPTSFSALKTAAKPNLENQPPYAAVFVLVKPQHMVVFLSSEIVLPPQGIKIPGFGTGDEAIYVWFSSACTNMGQQSQIQRLLVALFGHKNSPSHGLLGVLYHE